MVQWCSGSSGPAFCRWLLVQISAQVRDTAQMESSAKLSFRAVCRVRLCQNTTRADVGSEYFGGLFQRPLIIRRFEGTASSAATRDSVQLAPWMALSSMRRWTGTVRRMSSPPTLGHANQRQLLRSRSKDSGWSTSCCSGQ